MATIDELGTKVLQKLGVVAADEAPEPSDLAKAVEKVKAAHYAFGVQELAPFTLSDIPTYAEEPYVQMGAFLAAYDFEKQPDASWAALSTTELQRAANLKTSGIVPAEYF